MVMTIFVVLVVGALLGRRRLENTAPKLKFNTRLKLQFADGYQSHRGRVGRNPDGRARTFLCFTIPNSGLAAARNYEVYSSLGQ